MSACQIPASSRKSTIGLAGHDEWAAEWDRVFEARKIRMAAMLQSFEQTVADLSLKTDETDDRAYEAGYAIGEGGQEIADVAAPRHYTVSQALHFLTGVRHGANRRWNDYAEWKRERDAIDAAYDPYADIHPNELAESGSCVGH